MTGVDRRTFLAGQALVGLYACDNYRPSGHGEIFADAVIIGDMVLAKLQRTCEHHFPGPDDPWPLPIACVKCGAEKKE